MFGLHSCVLKTCKQRKHHILIPKSKPIYNPSPPSPFEPQRIFPEANDEKKLLMRFNEINCSVNIKPVQPWDVYVARCVEEGIS